MKKNWKTTLVGLTGGIPLATDAVLDAFKAGAFDGQSGMQLVIAIVIVLLGALSKDHNVTGGSTPQ